MIPECEAGADDGPSVEPISPTTMASTRTDQATWRRLAPIARKSASLHPLRDEDRKVLTMMNDPTMSATAAKIRRKLVMKLRLFWMEFAAS